MKLNLKKALSMRVKNIYHLLQKELISIMCHTEWKPNHLLSAISPRRHSRCIFASAALEVLLLNELRGLFLRSALSGLTDCMPARRPSCLPAACCPGRVKRRMCVIAVLWVEPHPDALAAAGSCSPPPLILVVLCAKSPAPDGRTQFDGTNERHCGGISKKKPSKKQTWIFNGHLILFFLSLWFFFYPVMLLLPRGC